MSSTNANVASVQNTQEVEDTIRELKKIDGFHGYCIFNNDGIVIKYENMTYKAALHHAHSVLSLMNKSTQYIRDLLSPPDNEVESLRLRTNDYEMIVTQHGNFTFVVLQKPHESKAEVVKVATEELKEEIKKE